MPVQGPPFAEQLSIAAFGHQVSALERCRLQARLALLDALPEEEIGKSPLSLPSTWIATASDEVLTGLSFKSVAKESWRTTRSNWGSWAQRY